MAELIHTAAPDVLIATGDDDGVFPGSMRREPRMLRRQITLNPTTGGRIKHGRVDEMHAICCRLRDPLARAPVPYSIAPS